MYLYKCVYKKFYTQFLNMLYLSYYSDLLKYFPVLLKIAVPYLTCRRSFPSTELLSVEISLDSDSQRVEGKPNGGAWCTGDIVRQSHSVTHCILVEL